MAGIDLGTLTHHELFALANGISSAAVREAANWLAGDYAMYWLMTERKVWEEWSRVSEDTNGNSKPSIQLPLDVLPISTADRSLLADDRSSPRVRALALAGLLALAAYELKGSTTVRRDREVTALMSLGDQRKLLKDALGVDWLPEQG